MNSDDEIVNSVPELPSGDMEAFRRVLRSSKHIITVAGAGLSAASGIPTFRGAGGLWRTFDAISLATPQAFTATPNRVWQFYHYRSDCAPHDSPILTIMQTRSVIG